MRTFRIIYFSGRSPKFFPIDRISLDGKANMYCTVHGGGLRGLASYVALVEVDVSRGLPGFEMVGLLGSEVREARERIRVALKNAQVALPAVRITVNISPADIHKAGTAYDLPVALGIMAAWRFIPSYGLEGLWVAGELGLSGEVKPVRGILPMVMEAAATGMRECLLPFENLGEGAMAGEIVLMGVKTLQEAADYIRAPVDRREELRRQAAGEWERTYGGRIQEGGPVKENWDFSMVRQLWEAKRAALIAAAGFHNLLLTGPPGAGKTMLARCIPSVLPPMSREEQREISSVYSVAGKLAGGLVCHRPFVSPHHTISPVALAGGGNVPRPGMVSLAHRGVLFLDEMAEFKRGTLDILRQPMEEGRIFLARGGGHFVYPAEFMLVAATNPCPCGYYPDRNRCSCTAYEVRRYLSRISGPLLDRIDLSVRVERLPVEMLWKGEDTGESSARLQMQVMEARERQRRRFRDLHIEVNAALKAGEVLRYCRLGLKEQQYLEQVLESMHISARGCHRILKVARTIADLEKSDAIACAHLGEAICYRKNSVFSTEEN